MKTGESAVRAARESRPAASTIESDVLKNQTLQALSAAKQEALQHMEAALRVAEAVSDLMKCQSEDGESAAIFPRNRQHLARSSLALAPARFADPGDQALARCK
jgi:hypothetical protein